MIENKSKIVDQLHKCLKKKQFKFDLTIKTNQNNEN